MRSTASACATVFVLAGVLAASSAGCTGRRGPRSPIDDRFVASVTAVGWSLRSRGLEIEQEPISSEVVAWEPLMVGRRMVVRDPRRMVPRTVPYAATRPAGVDVGPAEVHPQVTLYLFPLVRLSTVENLVVREQPGNAIAALDGAVVFVLPPAQSGDQDNGVLERTIEEALGGGLSRVDTTMPPPDEPPAAEGDARAVLWSVRDGARVNRTILPVRRR